MAHRIKYCITISPWTNHLSPLSQTTRLNARKHLPAQPVDATRSNVLIRQRFPERSDLFVCTRSKPSQGSVPADLTPSSDLAFVFNASLVRPECCVDPLRPPLRWGLYAVQRQGFSIKRRRGSFRPSPRTRRDRCGTTFPRRSRQKYGLYSRCAAPGGPR